MENSDYYDDGLTCFPLRISPECERLFDEIIDRPWGICREIRGWQPSLDLYETDEAFILEADLPGVKSGDVKMEIQDNDLILRGSRSLEARSVEGQFHTMERGAGYFVRRLKLPQPVDNDTVTGEYHNGVLRARLPKANRAQT
jgi:HSP20 family protein